MKPHTAQRLQHGRYHILIKHWILTGVSREDLDGAELTPRQTRQLLVLKQRQGAARSRKQRSRSGRRCTSHVTFAASMGAMCGAEDAKPVYDASVSLTHADGREIGCAKCREMFVAEVTRGSE